MNDPAQVDFDRGDFQAAARTAVDPVLKGLSLIMIGNPVDGLPLVASVDTADPGTAPLTAATIAFGQWLDGKASVARAILAARPHDRLAAAFLALLSAPVIPCLFQSARAPLLKSCKEVDGFSTTTLGSGGQNCDINLDDCDTASLSNAIQDAAFLFGFDFAGPVPGRPRDCTTPYLVHLTDPDVHILTGLHPVRRYDRAIAGTSGQAAALRAVTEVETVSAPFLGGLSALHPSLADIRMPERPRSVDLFFSGSFGTPIYHEKPERFFATTQLPNRFRIDLFDSTRPLNDYAASLHGARFALVSVRAPGSFSTRAMQALECGALVLCEAESGVLDMFPGPDWGVFTYRPDRIAEDIAEHLSKYEQYHAELAPQWGRIRARLHALSPGSPAAEERWLKYAAFQSLLIRHRGGIGPRPQCIAPPLDWFTVRGMTAPSTTREPHGRAARYSALAWNARQISPPPSHWLSEDGTFSPLEGATASQPPLQHDLAGAFLLIAETWQERRQAAFEAGCEAIWQRRSVYSGQRMDGLAIPDFWMGVFLNRLGLQLGRLYQHCVEARLGARPPVEADLLTAALGMAAAERAWARGDERTASTRAREVLEIDPANHAAGAMRILCMLKVGKLPDVPFLEPLNSYPWHLPRIMDQLTGKPALDSRVANGALHKVYLRFFQRMRDSRPLLSPTVVPNGAASYLAWKFGFKGSETVELILDRLRREELLLIDDDDATRLIIAPILAALTS